MSKKILIIDDEELIVRSLARLLQKNGYTVFVAKRGEDALVMAEEEEFDLIIADIRMPGMNGVETIKQLNAHLESRSLSLRPV
ncbi:MAG: response regulator, partial [Candidatus Omnitrophica bacterium]|nr:response regulator [Candidatus Omnitrophota bacterium]